MNNANKIPNFPAMARDLKKNTLRYASVESKKFFREGFVKEGWTGSSFTPWTKSSSPLAGKRTLYKSGQLMRSIRSRVEGSSIVNYSNAPHSELHNNGGNIIVSDAMKKYFWYKYMLFKKSNKKKAEYCKAMALKPAGSVIKMKQRQFLGHSDKHMDNLKGWFSEQIKNEFTNHSNQL